MRRIIFVVLAVVVAALVALLCWREFLVAGINFVADYTLSISGNHLKVQRLYAAEVDHEAFNAALNSITNTTDYTEEEIFAAAIASGSPEFFPSFNLGMYRFENEVRLDGFVDIELAEGQSEIRYRMQNISLEIVVTQGELVVERLDVVSTIDGGYESVIKVNSEKQAAADITDAKAFRIAMTGDEGSITLRFVYNIEADSFMPRTVLADQLLEVHVVFSPGVGANMDVEFIAEPYSHLGEIIDR
ncbi:MAG: hypothetical protein FWH07_02310 [Oscillospiraceae bacterium]|nr:hypothetical protein [Oscillospiraceae bacterium]